MNRKNQGDVDALLDEHLFESHGRRNRVPVVSMNYIRPPFRVLCQNEAEVPLHSSGEQRHFLVGRLSVVDPLVVEPLASTLFQTLHQKVTDAFEMPFLHSNHVWIDAPIDPSPLAIADEPVNSVQ